ncbi:MAG: hypothetical protein P1U85_18460 [Verrucomicrobiales bacterium]|nr:hypothetical protein [Verrucomicrobiales bacterium]
MKRPPISLIARLSFLLLVQWADAGDFQPAVTLGIVENPELIELSGVVEGGVNRDVLWVHNDRHNLPRLYALNLKGETIATGLLDAFNEEGTMEGDWEDLAKLPGKRKGSYDLYLADFGNNPMKKREHRLLVVEEPQLDSQKSSQQVEVDYREIRFEYPGDFICNSECLLAHPISGELWIVSKAVKEGKKSRPGSAVWSLSNLEAGESVHTATLVMESIPAVEGVVTGGDISPDGRRVIIRTTASTAYLWELREGKTLKETFLSAPTEVELADEKGGEAICFSKDGSKLYTVYDGKKPNRPLHVYEKNQLGPGE